MRKTDVVLLAEIDQIKTALQEAMRILDLGALGVACASCGAKRKDPCYRSDWTADPHEVRIRDAKEKLRLVLSDALAIGKGEAQPS